MIKFEMIRDRKHCDGMARRGEVQHSRDEEAFWIG